MKGSSGSLFAIDAFFIWSTVIANESILAPVSKQTESSYSPCDLRLSNCFPLRWLALAIFSLASPDLAADHSPKLKHL
jgi:hypothetical protein